MYESSHKSTGERYHSEYQIKINYVEWVISWCLVRFWELRDESQQTSRLILAG